MRTCCKCNKTLDDSAFAKVKHSRVCRTCDNAAKRERYRKNPIIRKKAIAQADAYRKKYPDKVRDTKLQCMYGLEKGGFDLLMKKQGGACAVCKKLPETETLQLDHSHVTGKIRGLLCRHCNVLLGYARESVDCLQSAIAYLKEHG